MKTSSIAQSHLLLSLIWDYREIGILPELSVTAVTNHQSSTTQNSKESIEPFFLGGCRAKHHRKAGGRWAVFARRVSPWSLPL